jgi:hypothetical protein
VRLRRSATKPCDAGFDTPSWMVLPMMDDAIGAMNGDATVLN